MRHYCLCLFIGLLAVAFLQSGALASNASMPKECCFMYHPRRIPFSKVTSYIDTRMECKKPGVILITQKGLRICVNPALGWVKSALNKIDDRDF